MNINHCRIINDLTPTDLINSWKIKIYKLFISRTKERLLINSFNVTEADGERDACFQNMEVNDPCEHVTVTRAWRVRHTANLIHSIFCMACINYLDNLTICLYYFSYGYIACGLRFQIRPWVHWLKIISAMSQIYR